jgi:hypothetical protein
MATGHDPIGYTALKDGYVPRLRPLLTAVEEANKISANRGNRKKKAEILGSRRKRSGHMAHRDEKNVTHRLSFDTVQDVHRATSLPFDSL